MTAWSEGTLVGIDTESTGVNPLEDRIVTAAFVVAKPGARPNIVQWIIDPLIEVPEEAAAVHGWTRARIVAETGEGMALRIGDGQRLHVHADGALGEIAGLVARAMQVEAPLVAHNAVFDLTLLDSELTRYGIDPLAARPSGVRGVVDPMVIEKQFDTYRKVCQKAPGCDPLAKVHECGGCRGGKWKCGGCGATDKTLTSLCRHYGVPLVGAHDAAADALAAVRLARRLGTLWPSVGRWKLGTLHEHQVTWKREQSDSLRAFWKKNGDERWAEVSSEWPLQTVAESVPA